MNPCIWNAWAQDGALWRCPDDPAVAYSGRRGATFQAARGTGFLRYGPLPAPRPGPWTVQLWARGAGQLVVGAYKTGGQTECPQLKPIVRRKWVAIPFAT